MIPFLKLKKSADGIGLGSVGQEKAVVGDLWNELMMEAVEVLLVPQLAGDGEPMMGKKAGGTWY